MSCISVPFVQILFDSSLFALVVEASGSWCRIGMLAFLFPSVPWCDGIQVMIIICLCSLVHLVLFLCQCKEYDEPPERSE